MKISRLQNISLLLITLVLFVAVLLHFIITLMHVMPFNPATSRWSSVVQMYTATIFRQNWHLFAPDPLAANYKFFMQVKYHNENQELVESEWVDLSSPMLHANWNNPISPINRLMRFGTDAFSQIHHKDEVMEKYEKKKELANKQEPVTEAETENQKELEKFRKKGEDLLYRMGYSNVPKYFPNKQVASIRLQVEIEKVKPFSERRNPDFETEKKYLEFNWKDYVPVMPSI